MQPAKITITKEEYDVMINSDFLLKKAQVIQKIKYLFLQLQESLMATTANMPLPEEILKPHGKISSGENYNGLPYLILDCPRYFDKENIFAFRSMFWWGNYFLFTLHLQGRFYNQCKEIVLNNLKSYQSGDLYINHGDDPWKHHIGAENLVPLKESNYNPGNNGFIKIAKRLELSQWRKIPSFGNETFLIFMQLLRADEMP